MVRWIWLLVVVMGCAYSASVPAVEQSSDAGLARVKALPDAAREANAPPRMPQDARSDLGLGVDAWRTPDAPRGEDARVDAGHDAGHAAASCSAACTTDSECSSTCPAAPLGSVNCCDTATSGCFQSTGTTCPHAVGQDAGDLCESEPGDGVECTACGTCPSGFTCVYAVACSSGCPHQWTMGCWRSGCPALVSMCASTKSGYPAYGCC